MFLKLLLPITFISAMVGAPVMAAEDDDGPNFGFAGILSHENTEELPPITLSSGQPLADAPWTLKSGKYYKVEINADGTAEMGLTGPEFFRAVWVDEVVINDIETRPFGVSSFEFDDEGTIKLSFVAIMPGQYELYIPGARGDSQKLQVTIQ